MDKGYRMQVNKWPLHPGGDAHGSIAHAHGSIALSVLFFVSLTPLNIINVEKERERERDTHTHTHTHTEECISGPVILPLILAPSREISVSSRPAKTTR